MKEKSHQSPSHQVTSKVKDISQGGVGLSKKSIIGLILFIGVFGFYLYSVAPSVAPYRDAGEMATVAFQLGVAHPPGYPLYILCGNIFQRLIPFGTIAYRLNILSALFMAGSVIFVFGIMAQGIPGWGSIRAAVLCLLLGSAGGFWYATQISEMYTAHIFACSCLLWLLLRLSPEEHVERKIYLSSFLGGLFLGFRMDLMLAFPAMALCVMPFLLQRKKRIVSISISAGVFFITGLSVYLYLYFRSRNNPVINWGSPDTLEKLFNVLSRKTHGHTLDLLSTHYKTGELFLSELWIYSKDLFWQFSPAGIPLIMYGAYVWFKKHRWICAGLITGFVLTGPLFIFLSNLPPNPHALAIMEPHYLLPNLFLFCLGAGAGGMLFPRSGGLSVVFLVIFTGVNIFHFRPRFLMRHNYFAVDYTRNVLRCLPPDSIVVVKEDVQLFSLWYAQHIMHQGKTSPVVAQGLAGSQWYQKNMRSRFPFLHVQRLNSAQQWKQFVALNPRYAVYISNDVEFPATQELASMPYGLLNRIYIKGSEEKSRPVNIPELSETENLLKEFVVRRGIYQYETQLNELMNFFNADLVEDYSSSWRKLGYRMLRDRDFQKAEQSFYHAVNMKKIIPTVYYHWGYLYFEQEEYEKARMIYEYAVHRYTYYLGLTKKYHSLPSVVSGIKKEFAQVYLHLGVAHEKLGDEAAAIHYFEKAIEVLPAFAQAYFNLGTVYWKKKRWDQVIYYMEQAVYHDPQNMRFRQYLTRARGQRARGQTSK